MEKRSIYVDMRDADENDTMDNWNDEKLKEVVEKKHGTEKRMPTTDIVSKTYGKNKDNGATTLILIRCDFVLIVDLQVFLGRC